MQTYIAVATTEELSDASSWVNTSYEYPQNEYDQFFKALGEARAVWSAIEYRLEAILYAAIPSEQGRALTAAYHSLEGFRAQLGMVGAALGESSSVTFTPTEWEALRVDVRRASTSRNDIVHHPVFYDHSAPEGRKFFIAPGGIKGIDSRKHKSEIDRIAENFANLDERLLQFWVSLKQT